MANATAPSYILCESCSKIDFQTWYIAATRVVDSSKLKDFIVGTIAEIETRPDCTLCSFIYQAWQSGFPASYLASLSTETKAKSGLRLSPRLKEKWHDLLELVTDCPTPIGIFLTTQWTLEEVNRNLTWRSMSKCSSTPSVRSDHRHRALRWNESSV